MENKKINTKNVPIGIPTIQKSVPKSAGTTSTKNNMTGGNEKEKSSSSGMISTTDKKLFIDLIDLDEKINTKPNIDPGTVTIGNIPNFDDTPTEPKIKQIVQHGNNKKIENKEDGIFNDQVVEWSKKDIKE